MSKQTFSINFQEWAFPRRLELLDEFNIPYKLRMDIDCIEIPYTLSSGQMEILLWVCNPVREVNFSILDKNLGFELLNWHYRFWDWKLHL